MRVLFVSSEAYPFAKTGGLADVSHALPLALRAQGGDARLLLPGYPGALEKLVDGRVPARRIAENSAVDVARMMEGKGAFGFDAAKNAYVDLLEAGIIDPVKVVRVALENAVSVASLMLLTEAP